jgi:ribosomal-protein-serine acetyltransferase
MTTTFPIDRLHPPRRIVYRDDARHVEVRPWTLSDADALVAAVQSSLAEVRAFMVWAHMPLSREGEYDLIAKLAADYWAGRQYVVGIFDGDGTIVGGAGLHPRTALNPRALELGYWIRTAHAGKGYATLASQMLIALAFDRLGCDRLQVMHDEANAASRRVVEKCGFVHEGTLRNVVEEASPKLRADGYRGTELQRLYAIVPSDLPGLEWLPRIRAGTTVDDALGGGPFAMVRRG